MKPGHVIAERYEVRGQIGRGGMGEVYLAVDHRLQTEVALKRVPLDISIESDLREVLVREARIMAKLSHSKIVRLFDLADTVDGLFLVLEYVCGPSLDRVLMARPHRSPREVAHLIDEVAEGLTLAHSVGVIHRDLKPSNLLLALEGDQKRRFQRENLLPESLLGMKYKVTDFGIAKVIAQQSMTNALGNVVGTPRYMAPEQIKGEMPSAETDVYSLALIAYECLSGMHPMGDAQPAYFHVFVTPPPLQNVPAYMNAAILKALSKERADRFSSVAQFAAALHGAAEPAPQPQPPPPPPPQPDLPTPPGKYHRRRRQIRLALIAGALGVVIAAAYLVPRALRTAPQTEQRQANSSPLESSEQTPVEPDPDELLSAQLAPLAPLNPAPRIDALPPVIDSARSPADPVPLPRTLQQPVLLGRARVTGTRPWGFGPDGTLYVSSSGAEIGAIREGKLLWMHKLTTDQNRFGIAADGLIWMQSGSRGDLFCFNAAGQGGELTASARTRLGLQESPVPAPVPAERCADPDATHNDPALDGPGPYGKPAWSVALDQRCSGEPLHSRSGMRIVQTKARTVYAVTASGRVRWTQTAPCLLDNFTLLSNDVAVGTCDQRKQLVGIGDSSERFSRRFERSVSGPLAIDRDGGFYVIEATEQYDSSFLTRLDGDGRTTWRYPLTFAITPTVALAPNGHIYLLSSSPAGSEMHWLGERR